MLHTFKNLLINFRVWLYKNLTLLLFFILPAKVSNIFVSLSILSLIYDVRKIDIKEHSIDGEKFKTLLNISYNQEIMVLPQYTVNWFWDDQFLNKSVCLKGINMTLKEALQDNKILFNNLRVIVDELLCNIPSTLQHKLGFKQVKRKLEVKHTVMNLLIHA